jgi:hypothetical protein
VDNIRFDLAKHLFGVGETSANTKAFRQLPRHPSLEIAHGDNLGVGDPMDCLHVLVRDFAAAD